MRGRCTQPWLGAVRGGYVRGCFVAAVVVVNNDDNVSRFLAGGGGGGKMDDKTSGIGTSRLRLRARRKVMGLDTILMGGSEYEDFGEEGAK
jgi:hypothetical protein